MKERTVRGILVAIFMATTMLLLAAGRQEDASAARASAAPHDPFGKYEPTVTLTAVRDTIAAFEFPAGDCIENNVWTREIEATLGIRVRYDWTIDMSQYAHRLNLAIVSGDLPDFFLADRNVFRNLAENALLADLTDAYENYATPEFRATMDAFPEGFESAHLEGRLYGISPQGWGIMSVLPVLWIRDDWMQQLDLKPPESIADLEAIATTFVVANPENRTDMHGVSLWKDYFGGLQNIEGIANAHHAYPGIWIRDASGQIVYGSIQPEMRNTLQTLQKWYDAGILSQEYGIKTHNACNEDLISGRVGIQFGHCWNSRWPLNALVQNDQDAVFKPHAIPSVDGNQVSVQATFPVANYWVVNKDCDYPEAAIKMANLFNRMLYHGTPEEYVTFIRNEQGHGLEKLSPIHPTDPRTDYRKHVLISEAIRTGDASGLSAELMADYDSLMPWVENRDPVGYGPYYHLGPEGSYSVLREFVDSDNVMMTELRGVNPPTMVDKWATLFKLEQDAYTKVIIGGDITEFDRFVENWLRLGGEQITREMNEMYK